MVGTTATTTKILSNVTYKQEVGTLTLNEQVFHFQANAPSKTSVKCSWGRVEKRQLSPASSDQHMIKLLLMSGKMAIFSVKDRATLEELRHDCQIRMDAAKNIQDPVPANKNIMSGSSRSNRATSTWEDEPVRQKSTPNDKSAECCGWVCVTSAFCCFLFCVLLLLMAVAAFLIYWFVFKDTDAANDILVNTGIRDDVDKSKPPDYGNEARYGIRNPVNHDWNQDEMILHYKLSDYILDKSIRYHLYDGLKCRDGSNDITANNQYLVMTLVPPDDGGPDLNNEGRGSRLFDLKIVLNKGLIANAPFFKPLGLEEAVLEFCVGLSIIYNQVEYWGQEQEVNAAELAIQMKIDLSDFRRIENVDINPVVRPVYTRRKLRGGPVAVVVKDTDEALERQLVTVGDTKIQNTQVKQILYIGSGSGLFSGRACDGGVKNVIETWSNRVVALLWRE